MITVTTKNLYEGGAFDAEGNGYVMHGDYRKNPLDGKVTSMSASVNVMESESEGEFIGSVNAYTENGVLKYNLSSIALTHLVAVAGLVADLIAELEK